METRYAMRNIDSRTLFAPYFRARWQNMENIINDSTFFSMIPEPYVSYYRAYIQQWLQWSTGFVPMLHRSDFFATGMGYTVCDLFARECMSGGFRIDSRDEETTDFMATWGEPLSDIFNQMYFFSNAGGNAILSITPVDGELRAGVKPINRVLFTIGKNGEIDSAVLLNRFVGGADEIYYARETRVLLEDKPYYKVELALSSGLSTSPNWNTNFVKEVPLNIAGIWKATYGDIEPNTWYTIPRIKTLGLYNVRNKSIAVALADLPGYSDSTLHTATDLLYAIDFNYTSQQMDMYWGKTRVFIPPAMEKRTISTNGVMNVAEGMSYVQSIKPPALSEEVYVEIPSGNAIDGKPIQPTFIQPDMRGEIHKQIRDADLELLASKVGLSSSTLANHLSYNSAKTATEVRAEQGTTEISVNNKRSLANIAINAMLKDVAIFYGLNPDTTINWNRAGVNSTAENSQLLEDYQAGTLPLKEYLKRRWRDLSESEVDEWAVIIEQKEKERQSFGVDSTDEFKDVVVDYE